MSNTMTLAGVEIHAVSVGGLETCIELPGLRIGFDIGRCPPSAARLPTILFTHSHIDHMGGIVHHAAMRDLFGYRPPTYVVPATDHGAFLDMLQAWRRLSRSDLPCTVRPVRPGERLDLGRGRSVHVFRSTHRVPTLGYAVVREVQRLRPELVGLPPYEIGRLRQAGQQVTLSEEVVEVAFCGDTTTAVIEREARVRQARLLILECTFLDERVPVERALRTGHVHLDELLARAHLLGNERILLTHFSRRYGPKQIRDILDARLPPELRERVVPLVPGPPWVPERS